MIIRSIRDPDQAVVLLKSAFVRAWGLSGRTAHEFTRMEVDIEGLCATFDTAGVGYRLPVRRHLHDGFPGLQDRSETEAGPVSTVVFGSPWAPPRLVSIRDTEPVMGINVLVTLKNRGEHFQRMLASLERSAEAYSGDRGRLRIIVVDFGSTDLDLTGVLEGSGLEHQLTMMVGDFSKTRAIAAAMAAIEDDRELAVMLDADMSVPAEFFQVVRDSVIAGRQFFAPVVSGATNNRGYSRGYGNLALTKGDFTAVAGFGPLTGSTHYGGEDLYLAAQLMRRGLRMKRFEWMGFDHMPHPPGQGWRSASDRPRMHRDLARASERYLRVAHDGDDDTAFDDTLGRAVVTKALGQIPALGGQVLSRVERYVHPLFGFLYRLRVQRAGVDGRADSRAPWVEIGHPFVTPLAESPGFPLQDPAGSE